MHSKLTRASVAVAAFCTLVASAASALAYVPTEGPPSDPQTSRQAVAPELPLKAAVSLMERALTRVHVDEFDQLSWPVRGAINTPFSGDHAGIDIEGETGDPIVAAASGRITFAGDDGDGYGTKILIRHDRVLSTLYSHLSDIKVSRGFVDRGEVIGYVGCTGSCTGDHLHFEVHRHDTPVSPLEYLKK